MTRILEQLAAVESHTLQYFSEHLIKRRCEIADTYLHDDAG